MSLPTPTTSLTPNNLSTQQIQQLDAPLIALTQRCNGDLRLVFHSFFSFLNRRTDFYCVHNQNDVDEGVKVSMGFKEGDAEKLLLAAYKQFPLRRMPPVSQMKQADSKKVAVPAKKDSETVTKTKKDSESTAVSPTPPAEQKKAVTSSETDATSGLVPTAEHENENEEASESNPKEAIAGVRYTEDGFQIPVGNGGSTKDYKWTQTIQEITIAMPLPSNPDTRAKDLNVQIKQSAIEVNHKLLDKSLLNGEFIDKIRVDESTWSIESNLILITLEKVDKRWWNRVLEEDTESIAVSLVDKTHKISDYDEATQGMARRILFDQRQERLGLPSSDEIMGIEVEEDTGLDVLRDCHGKKVDVGNLPPGVQFIDKHNFPGGAPKR